ncbi:MAG: DUF1236 domain-containing protein [Xanthobacteraceae bacterium]|nr:DUF1236 domain-containing protein [Xanthobacteraceae bacterium]
MTAKVWAIAIASFATMTAAAAQPAPHMEGHSVPHETHGGAGLTFTPEHGAMLRQHAATQHYAPVHDPAIHAQVGATLPGSVELHPLPDALAGHLPAARSYRYTIIGNRPVVVDPGSHRIVHVGE